MSETWNVTLALTVSNGSVETLNEAVEINETKNDIERRKITLADATDDQEVDLTDLGTVEELLVISDNPISLKKDVDSNTAILGKVFLLSGSSLTKLYLSNGSGNTATVKIIAGG